MTAPLTINPIPLAFAEGDFGDVLSECTAMAGNGRAVMFDGTDLFITRTGDINVYKFDVNCVPLGSCISPVAVVGALALDPNTGNAWAGDYVGAGLIWEMNPNTCALVSGPFAVNHGGPPAETFPGFVDGIAFDTSDGTLWVGTDLAPHIHHMDTAGANLGTCTTPSLNAGVTYNAIQDNLVVTQYDSSSGFNGRISELAKSNAGACPLIAEFPILPYLAEGLDVDATTFPGTLVVWSNSAGSDNVLRAWVLKEFDATKDCRFTNVEFNPIDPGPDGILGTPDDIPLPANLGGLLPTANGDPDKFDVDYVLKPKDGTVSSTNPGQVYCVITITGNIPFDNVVINDDFGVQFDVNPAHVGGGVEVIHVIGGFATVLTDTGVITSSNVDNTSNDVDLTLDLSLGPTGQVDPGESLMIYIKYKTSEKGDLPIGGEFVNTAAVNVEGLDAVDASATIELFS
jgi:hypothetical protein